jgi:uncharacterized lipoprotein YmbA
MRLRPPIGTVTPIRSAVGALAALVLVGCAAAPPLQLYTLSDPPTSNGVLTTADDPPPPQHAPVIEVTRVTVPAYLDSQDLLVRDGNVLKRSSTGRWADRLSLGATDLLTERLAMRRPDAWVVARPPARNPDYRLQIHITRLDIVSSGTAVVEAEWEIVPNQMQTEIIRRRARLIMHGSVATDESTTHFERALLNGLADQIDVSSLH